MPKWIIFLLNFRLHLQQPSKYSSLVHTSTVFLILNLFSTFFLNIITIIYLFIYWSNLDLG